MIFLFVKISAIYKMGRFIKMKNENRESAMKKFLDRQQPFSGIVGASLTIVVTVLLTLLGGSAFVSTQYVSIDSLDVLINKYFVSSGLVSEDVLGLDTTEQFEIIAKDLSNCQAVVEGNQSNLESILVSNGIEVEGKSLEDIYNILNDLIVDYASLSEENEQFKEQRMAEIMSVRLVVDGEEIDVNIPNSTAKIDGHVFYSESLLNSFLNEKISTDLSNSTVYYGNERAEKTVFNTDMITDINGFEIYSVGNGNSFTMGTDTYDNGFIETNTNSSRFYANLKGEYSKISFVVGHIDGTNMENETIYIYTKNGNDQYRLLKTFDLAPDMFPETKSVDINYADGIQIVIEGSYWGKYALADVYLYR